METEMPGIRLSKTTRSEADTMPQGNGQVQAEAERAVDSGMRAQVLRYSGTPTGSGSAGP